MSYNKMKIYVLRNADTNKELNIYAIDESSMIYVIEKMFSAKIYLCVRGRSYHLDNGKNFLNFNLVDIIS